MTIPIPITEQELAELEAKAYHAHPTEVRALVDALRASWAERDVDGKIIADLREQLNVQDNEIDSLRADLAKAQRVALQAQEMAKELSDNLAKAQARIAELSAFIGAMDTGALTFAQRKQQRRFLHPEAKTTEQS